MAFEDAAVAVPDGEGVLGADYKLVGVARVFVVVDAARDEHSQRVVLLQILLHISRFQHKVQPLHRVQHVDYVVVRVVLEVTRLNFTREVDQVFKFDVVDFEEVVLLEQLVSHVLERVVNEDLVEVESIEVGLLDSFQGQLNVLHFHVHQVRHLQKLQVHVLHFRRTDRVLSH